MSVAKAPDPILVSVAYHKLDYLISKGYEVRISGDEGVWVEARIGPPERCLWAYDMTQAQAVVKLVFSREFQRAFRDTLDECPPMATSLKFTTIY